MADPIDLFQQPDLTRWNRSGLSRFTYTNANAALFLELMRKSFALDFEELWPDLGPPTPTETYAEWMTRVITQYQGARRDWGWEIARTFARAAHILSGHLDAYANEGYLRTATQWDNVRKIVQLVNYTPKPPSSATTTLALNVKAGKGSGLVSHGFGVTYTPPKGNQVYFETLQNLEADEALNALNVAAWDKATYRYSSYQGDSDPTQFSLWTVPASWELTVGQPAILIDASNAAAPSGYPAQIATLGAVNALDPADAGKLSVGFSFASVGKRPQGALANLEAYLKPKLQIAAPLAGTDVIVLGVGHGISQGQVVAFSPDDGNTFTFYQVLDADAIGIRVSDTPTYPSDLSLVRVFATVRAVSIAFSGASTVKLTDDVSQAAANAAVTAANNVVPGVASDAAEKAAENALQQSNGSILSTILSFFTGGASQALSAAQEASLSTAVSTSVSAAVTEAIKDSLGNAVDLEVQPAVQKALDGSLPGADSSFSAPYSTFPAEVIVATDDTLTQQVTTLPNQTLLSGYYVPLNAVGKAVIASPSDTQHTIYFPGKVQGLKSGDWMVGAIDSSVAGYAPLKILNVDLQSKMTIVKVDSSWWTEPYYSYLIEQLPFGGEIKIRYLVIPPTIKNFYAAFQKTLQPLGWDENWDPLYSGGTATVELECPSGLTLQNLVRGRQLLIDVRQSIYPPVFVPASSAPVATAPVLASVVSVTSVGSAGNVQVTLATQDPKQAALPGFYKWNTIVRANAVVAGHGKTQSSKVLGSGDATASNQSFVLQVSDVSFIPDSTQPTGVSADIEVQVGAQTWIQVPNLSASFSDSPHYTVRMTEDRYLTIAMGDGRHGRRLPTGVNNVSVTYRVGSGTAGNVSAGCLLKAAKPDPLVDTIVQPLPAIGGNSVEPVSSLRKNAPAALVALGRAVSLEDYGALANQLSGIWQAKALKSVTVGRGYQVTVAVVLAQGLAPQGTYLTDQVETPLMNQGLPGVTVKAVNYTMLELSLKITIGVDSTFDKQDVQSAVTANLTSVFALQNRKLGQSLYLSEVVDAVESVAGVTYSECVIQFVLPGGLVVGEDDGWVDAFVEVIEDYLLGIQIYPNDGTPIQAVHVPGSFVLHLSVGKPLINVALATDGSQS